MIALSLLNDFWEEREGSVFCLRCRRELGRVCKQCGGTGFVELRGRPERFVRGGSQALMDAVETVQLCYWARERPMHPREWLEQPARWAAAYWFLVPYINYLQELKREQARARGK